ncbi:hypothetical protein [Herbaspirillum sp. SJZ107]|uniref:hypothetical protein n=1 Tax=Herbaspirillum sp. SJZ107 TaxID=2572881 RepID=UPI00114F7794|nr:hypothetical protein [Herbaspirillum sp. SJZ107]
MPTYVKRHWNQTRGDEYDAWGTSWWYFEVDPDGWVTRQIEQYDGGVRLCYSTMRSDDQFGALAETPLDLAETAYLIISQAEFELLWRAT